ncbi:MAG: hypothetical protein HQM04_04310 [Magnetococcales bacterium]|nr:hypothetical protein [Magnetococcales bacterium]MBF0114247.1 hypothetical protein [Magnetococcales bacterium]
MPVIPKIFVLNFHQDTRALAKFALGIVAGATGGGLLLLADLESLRTWLEKGSTPGFFEGVTTPLLFAVVGVGMATAVAWLSERLGLVNTTQQNDP